MNPPRPFYSLASSTNEARPSGNEDGVGGGEARIYGKEVSQRGSHPYPDVKVVAESGPSQEGTRVNRENVPHSSTPIPCSGEPDSM